MNKTTIKVVGPNFVTLLLLLFIGLKLAGVITWGWIWVVSPIWIPFALAATLILVVGIVVGVILGFIFIVDQIYRIGKRKKR